MRVANLLDGGARFVHNLGDTRQHAVQLTHVLCEHRDHHAMGLDRYLKSGAFQHGTGAFHLSCLHPKEDALSLEFNQKDANACLLQRVPE